MTDERILRDRSAPYCLSSVCEKLSPGDAVDTVLAFDVAAGTDMPLQ